MSSGFHRAFFIQKVGSSDCNNQNVLLFANGVLCGCVVSYFSVLFVALQVREPGEREEKIVFFCNVFLEKAGANLTNKSRANILLA